MSESSFTFRVNAEVLKNLKTLATNNNRVASQLVRDFMIRYTSKDGLKWAKKILETDLDDAELSSKFSIRANKNLIYDFKITAKENNQISSKILRAAINQYIVEKTKT